MTKLYFPLAALLTCGMLLGCPARSRAQVFAPTPSAVVVSDTAEARQVVVSPAAEKQQAAADSAKRTEHLFRAFGYPGIRLTRPGKAALLALMLPGAGQIYNRRWWKLPLVYGSLGGVIYGEYRFQTLYREFADASNDIKEGKKKIFDTSLGPVASEQRSVEALDAGVVLFRGYRDLFYLYIGLAYGLQVVDALVDAHLKDFDVSDDLSLHWEPVLLPVPGQARALPTAPGVMFALRVR